MPYQAFVLFEGKEYLVKAFPVNVRYDAARIHFAAYFPMPYRRGARIELEGAGGAAAGVRFSVRRVPYRDPPNRVGYFHATYLFRDAQAGVIHAS
jgi:hypothetical protein